MIQDTRIACVERASRATVQQRWAANGEIRKRPYGIALAAPVLFTGAVGLMLLIFGNALRQMIQHWIERPEYSHGFLLPMVALFLVWQKQDRLRKLQFLGSWLGFALAALGVALFYVGELSTLYVIVQYAFLVVLAGVLLAWMGWRGFRAVAFALTILLLMVPLPEFILQNLSAKLQLLSSRLGVAIIRLFDISVFLEGNVIDLGALKLQVVEACDGLRYLFPLMTLALVAVHFFKAPLWKRLLVFVSSIPVTIVMNSIRIAIIGVLSEFGGPVLAEGFLHDFEGATVFMASAVLLLVEMWLLARIGSSGKRPFKEVFGFHLPRRLGPGGDASQHNVSAPLAATTGLLAAVALVSLLLPQRSEAVPRRDSFAAFPLQIGEWRGRPGKLDAVYVEALKFNDYILVDYHNRGAQRVNFYVAYYASQRKGASVHSPRSCIPGGGWEIVDLSEVGIANVAVNGVPLRANRAIIRRADEEQVVYYWFQQRGRIITNEYWVKWYLLRDALTANRTDGALVRLAAAVPANADRAQADRTLAEFSRAIAPRLAGFIPN
jgi:exosortase D (VPLPA-CTERM-specific)